MDILEGKRNEKKSTAKNEQGDFRIPFEDDESAQRGIIRELIPPLTKWTGVT